MGMPPPEPGRHITSPPRVWGGNIDCKELIAGTTLYLPIPVAGLLTLLFLLERVWVGDPPTISIMYSDQPAELE